MDDIQVLNARIRALEKRQQRFSRLAILLGVAGAAAIGVVAAQPAPSTVEARQVTVVDEAGRPRVALFATGDAAGMAVYQPDGTKRAVLSVASSGSISGFSLTDRTGRFRIGMSTEEGQSGITIRGSEGKRNAVFALRGKDSVLGMSDDTGEMATTVSVDPDGLAHITLASRGILRVGLSVSENESSQLAFYGSEKHPRTVIGVARDSSALLNMLDHNAKSRVALRWLSGKDRASLVLRDDAGKVVAEIPQ